MIQKKVILLVSIAVLFFSCKQTPKETNYVGTNSDESVTDSQQTSKGYALMKTYCYVCHNPNAISHDSIIAPPFRAVKMRYTMAFDNKEDFVNAIVNWVPNPDESKALMFGAVKRFKLMPKLPLEPKDIEAIASYIYDNDVEEPVWMEEHMKEMQGKGMNSKNN